MPWRSMAVTRFLVAAVAAIITAAVALAVGAPWGVALTASWCAGALLFLGTVWVSIGGKDPEETAAHANAEDSSRTAVDITLLGASIASLGAVGYTLVEAGHHSSRTQGLLVGLAVLAVALGWATVHTVYTLRYADLYYFGEPGGIDFGDEPPDYLDFAYFGFTVGMTYQVSDTGVKVRDIRRTVLRHSLLAYLFGAVIVAVAINLVATLLRG
jgi:uncharacterized membrane protein